jgi:hypothetical protein
VTALRATALLGALQIVLVILKAAHVVAWSWALVLAPAWVTVGSVAAALAIAAWLENGGRP